MHVADSSTRAEAQSPHTLRSKTQMPAAVSRVAPVVVEILSPQLTTQRTPQARTLAAPGARVNDVPAAPPVVTAAVASGATVQAASPPAPVEHESHAHESMSPPPAPARFALTYMPKATKDSIAKKIAELIKEAGASDTSARRPLQLGAGVLSHQRVYRVA